VTLGFHQPSLRMFRTQEKDTPAGRGNEIVIDFTDPGSITAGFLAKEPGAQMSLGAAKMTFRYQDSFCAANGLQGYERLILDAMLGDQALFTRADGVERLWEISAQLLENRPRPSPTPQGRGALSRRSGGWPPRSAGTCQTSAQRHETRGRPGRN
jgi:glucose-6-phosphate 1-dehydrogenase